MSYDTMTRPTASAARGSVRTLRQQEELPLLRDHLLRLDPESRHDRFHGFMDESFIERYAAKCADDGTVIIAYIEDGVVRGAAELHPPDRSPDSQPEIAFSVEATVRRQGVGSILFKKLIAEARAKGYRSLRITTGAQNQAMRALAVGFQEVVHLVRTEEAEVAKLQCSTERPDEHPQECPPDAKRSRGHGAECGGGTKQIRRRAPVQHHTKDSRQMGRTVPRRRYRWIA